MYMSHSVSFFSVSEDVKLFFPLNRRENLLFSLKYVRGSVSLIPFLKYGNTGKLLSTLTARSGI